MKYVSPIFEVEALETKDIICASNPETPGVNYLGNDKAAVEAAQNATTWTEDGTDADGKPVTNTGISVSVSFNNLFNN